MKKWLNKDDFKLGVALGLVLPAVVYLLLNGVFYLLDLAITDFQNPVEPHYLILLSTVVNLFSLRYYLVSMKYDKTGRGILGVTFIYILLYFILFH